MSLNDEFTTWSQGQKTAFDQLVELTETFLELKWDKLTFRPRFDVLLAGASGMGKTHLVQMLSRKLGVPRLRLSYSEWLVMGSRETPHTMKRIHDFVDAHPTGLIFIDELDKFRSMHTSDWSSAVVVELFFLLDRNLEQPGRDFQWTASLQTKLQRSFLIIGAGAWQSIWTMPSKPNIGFLREKSVFDPKRFQNQIETSAAIPPELLKRFSSEIVLLPPATEQDYRNAAQQFGLEEMAKGLGTRLDYAEAVERCLGARWLEESYARLLCIARKVGQPLFPSAPNM